MTEYNSQPESSGNPDYAIQKENAEDIFADLLDWYDIDEDDYKDGKDKGAAFKQAKRKIIKGICKGYVEVNKDTNKLGEEVLNVQQNFKFKYHKAPSRLLYREVNGKSKKAIKESEGVGEYGMMYKFLAALAGDDLYIVEQLKGVDIGLAESLGYLFLQV